MAAAYVAFIHRDMMAFNRLALAAAVLAALAWLPGAQIGDDVSTEPGLQAKYLDLAF